MRTRIDSNVPTSLAHAQRAIIREVFGYEGAEEPPEIWENLCEYDPSFTPTEVRELIEDPYMHEDLRRLVPLFQSVDTIRPGLLLGSAYGARRFNLLKRRGVTHVLNCAGDHVPNFFMEHFFYVTLDIGDSIFQPIADELTLASGCIKAVIDRGDTIYVHCQKGKSRSVAMVAGYLMATEHLTRDEALAEIRKHRSVADPNPGFMRQLDGEPPMDKSVLALESLKQYLRDLEAWEASQ